MLVKSPCSSFKTLFLAGKIAIEKKKNVSLRPKCHQLVLVLGSALLGARESLDWRWLEGWSIEGTMFFWIVQYILYKAKYKYRYKRLYNKCTLSSCIYVYMWKLQNMCKNKYRTLRCCWQNYDSTCTTRSAISSGPVGSNNSSWANHYKRNWVRMLRNNWWFHQIDDNSMNQSNVRMTNMFK